jgi:hypothetical protein
MVPVKGKFIMHASGRGGTRTHTPVARKGILSPLRLPFRHAARVDKLCRKTFVSVTELLSVMERVMPRAGFGQYRIRYCRGPRVFRLFI